MKKKKPSRKKKAKRAKKSTLAKKVTRRSKLARKKPTKKPRKKPVRRRRVVRGLPEVDAGAALQRRRINPIAAGASGDNQKLSQVEGVDSESVEELADEGQSYEAAAVSGVENALDPDQSEVTTKEVPEDDVPAEYRERDQ
jgi:hypothetical protein